LTYATAITVFVVLCGGAGLVDVVARQKAGLLDLTINTILYQPMQFLALG
jgi:hypothetical protein